MTFIILLLGIGIFYLLVAWIKKSIRRRFLERRAYLIEKYVDESLVDDIMDCTFWKGQSKEQLIDSIGHPDSEEKKVMRSKTKEIWKYNEFKKGQFSLKVSLEDDVVVGWDQKF